jgi:hypothetical protein
MAQNSDLGILFSVAVTKYNFGFATETRYSGGIQFNYAWQIIERPSGRLYIEVPVGLLSGLPVNARFVTPGLRYHFNLTHRLAVHAAVGAGIAVREQQFYTLAPIPNSSGVTIAGTDTSWRGSPAYDLGAGADFRLTRLLSLRGEARRFRTTDVFGFGDGKTYPSANIGLALHF